MGNMNSLCSGSQIWRKVKGVLEAQKAIGPELELQCAVHEDQKIRASQPSDFPAGGGCNLRCGVEMSCGHICQRPCHAYDLAHEKLKCTVTCSMKCPAQIHDCAKRHWENCDPCLIPTVKTIPICKHSYEMPCHIDPAQADCQVLCLALLECGHHCSQNCHVLKDPNHVYYDCQKPCERLCSEGHKCMSECGTHPCPPCTKIVDCILPCGHPMKLPCHVDINKYQCLRECSKTLPCGHHCHQKCSQACGLCQEPVKKVIFECGHEIQGVCSLVPKRAHCTKACERKLRCGHLCTNLCRDKCTEMCKILVPYSGGGQSR